LCAHLLALHDWRGDVTRWVRVFGAAIGLRRWTVHGIGPPRRENARAEFDRCELSQLRVGRCFSFDFYGPIPTQRLQRASSGRPPATTGDRGRSPFTKCMGVGERRPQAGRRGAGGTEIRLRRRKHGYVDTRWPAGHRRTRRLARAADRIRGEVDRAPPRKIDTGTATRGRLDSR